MDEIERIRAKRRLHDITLHEVHKMLTLRGITFFSGLRAFDARGEVHPDDLGAETR